ncbi:ABC transporter ATP-binding protein [Acidithrix ferrooxidans]|uniref:Oligopeptide transport ATP-binding protein OppF n=1 Tax=Acidithrix ferrooxidans TaxID=1280514 RepID=A0A0D8HFI9_9ACTN|nr:ABC transporter ATP-binding protein [Acidithrix ferrooxidans]KJF16688.1 oligopeptide transport ATP-binding protein OppF [Acidithrix ferrooxidans]
MTKETHTKPAVSKLDSEPIESNEVASAAASRGPLVMRAEGISKDYRISRKAEGVISAVKNVNLALYARGVVAVVGESGSGKSTIAKLLSGHEKLTKGKIFLDGAEIQVGNRSDFRRFKSDVQMVFQDPFASLNPVHTIRYHLERPVKLHQKTKGAEVETELLGLINQVKLTPPDQFLAKYPHELSGGQRQRVSIARALAAHPRVLLADEPVSMLDVSIRLEILSLLDDLRERLNLAMLYITHDIASARYFADEILVMYGGEIVERGPAEEVTQKPLHPYTQLLVSSSPDPDDLGSTLKTGATTVARQAGSALTNSVGCRFSDRCPFADDKCTSASPPHVMVGSNRSAACWHLDKAVPIIHLDARKETVSDTNKS